MDRSGSGSHSRPCSAGYSTYVCWAGGVEARRQSCRAPSLLTTTSSIATRHRKGTRTSSRVSCLWGGGGGASFLCGCSVAIAGARSASSLCCGLLIVWGKGVRVRSLFLCSGHGLCHRTATLQRGDVRCTLVSVHCASWCGSSCCVLGVEAGVPVACGSALRRPVCLPLSCLVM